MQRRKLLIALIPSAIAIAGLGGSYIVPIEHEAIQYSHAALSDPVSQLEARLEAGAAGVELKLWPASERLEADLDGGRLRRVAGLVRVGRGWR